MHADKYKIHVVYTFQINYLDIRSPITAAFRDIPSFNQLFEYL